MYLGRDDAWTHRRPLVKVLHISLARACGIGHKTCLGKTPLRHTSRSLRIPLPFSRAHIVPDCEASDVLHGFVARDVLGIFADDNAEFNLVVCLSFLCDLWHRDGFTIARQAGRWLEEEGRVRGWCPTAFLNCPSARSLLEEIRMVSLCFL